MTPPQAPQTSAKNRWKKATAKITEEQMEKIPEDERLQNGQKFRNMVREVVDVAKMNGDLFSPAEFGFGAAGPGFDDDDRPLASQHVQLLKRKRDPSVVLEQGGEALWIPRKERGEWRNRRVQIATIVLFMAVDSSRTVCDYRALTDNDGHSRQISQELVVAHSGCAFMSALFISMLAGGGPALKRAVSPVAVLQMFPVAIEFSLSAVALGQAYALGLQPADKEALGYLYMPLCALMSRYLFRRAYGWLSWQSLILVTLCSLTFVECRNRGLYNQHGVLDNFTVAYSFLSTGCSAIGSVLAERLLKAKYNVLSAGERFYVQKARLEVGSLLAASVLYWMFAQPEWGPLFSCWESKTFVALALRVVQSWLAGIMAKRLSAVAKAVIQCLSLLIVFFVMNMREIYRLSEESIANGDGQGTAVLILPVCLLAIVVALTAVMYQMGRQMTLEMRGSGRGLRHAPVAIGRILNRFGSESERPGKGFDGKWMKPDGLIQEILGHRLTWATGRVDLLRITGPSTFYIERDGSDLHAELIADGWQLAWSTGSTWCREEPEDMVRSVSSRPSLSGQLGVMVTDDFDGKEEASGWCPSIPSLAELDLFGMGTTAAQRLLMAPERAVVYDFLSTRAGMMGQMGAVVAFIFADAAANIAMGNAYNDKPIVGQSIAWMNAFTSLVIGTIVSTTLYGKDDGLLACWSVRDVVQCLPVAAFFSMGQTATNMAFSSGISASVNTVLGYFYMPCAAMLSRWVFSRVYSNLEWIALAVLSLSAVVFALLKQVGPPGAQSSGESGPSTSPLAAGYCLLSVVLSCVGAILAEKIMKSKPQPFFVQKVHLEIGGFLIATLMFEVVLQIGRYNDGWRNERNCTVAETPAANGTDNGTAGGDPQWGPFCCWSLSTFIALFARICQGWLGGLVAKQLSSVVKAVAQCLSLLLIYFFGDLVLKGEAFDWPVGVMSIVVALSVTIFTLAGQGVKRVWKAEAPAPAEVPGELPEEEENQLEEELLPSRKSDLSRASVDSVFCDFLDISSWHAQGMEVEEAGMRNSALK